ncbi:glycosyltransferase family 4 protein [Pontibacter liquoris]|uniref:glycosyltransferase family 4 protein n=1 Tax=Pontibacter liquoris TaxID=2905677 RepID=UPI001FA6ABA7|nr:glycosyltransferase family 1 protein [Pontibacter liquoris]
MQESKQKTIIVNARFLTQPVTGVQRFAIEISLCLKRLYPHAVFVAPRKLVHKEIAQQLEVVTFGHLAGHAWEQLELPLYLKKHNQPLLLNLCNTAPLFYRKQVVCIHDLAVFINPAWFSASFAAVYKFLLPRIARRSVKVLTVSNYSRQTIQSLLGIQEAKIAVIYNAVSDYLCTTGKEATPSKYGAYILAVGSLDPRKNLLNLVKAFNQCQLPGIKLVIVGATSSIFKDPALQQLLLGNDQIILTGYLPDQALPGLYRNALFFVYPSFFEGFGIPPLEAMQCGCATIVSNTSSLPEVCADASLYVNPTDIADIARAIGLLASDAELRNNLIHKGLERSRHFSWEKSAIKLMKVIERV